MNMEFQQYSAVKRANTWFKQLLSALCYMHNHGVLHRDIKPQNLLFKTPDREQLVVVDFGVSCHNVTGGGGDAKEASNIVGTPFYLSPELCRGEGYGCVLQ